MGKSFTVHCSPEGPVIYAQLIFSDWVMTARCTPPHHFTVILCVYLCVSPLSPPSSCTRSSRRPWGCRRKSKQSTGLCLPSQVGIGHACTSSPRPLRPARLSHPLFKTFKFSPLFQETGSRTSSSAWRPWPSRPMFCPSWRREAPGTSATSSVSQRKLVVKTATYFNKSACHFDEEYQRGTFFAHLMLLIVSFLNLWSHLKSVRANCHR